MDERRRRVLEALGAAGLVGVAGCSGLDGGATSTERRPEGHERGPGDGRRDGDAIAASTDASTVLVGAPRDEDPNVGGSEHLFE